MLFQLLAVAVLAIGGAVAGGLAIVQASDGRANLQNQLNMARSELSMLQASDAAITPSLSRACAASAAASNVDTSGLAAKIAAVNADKQKAALEEMKTVLEAIVAADANNRC